MSDEVKAVKVCPYCGESILDVAIKCKHCGADLNASKRKRTALWVALALVLVIAIAVGAFLVRPTDSGSGSAGVHVSTSDARRNKKLICGQMKLLSAEQDFNGQGPTTTDASFLITMLERTNDQEWIDIAAKIKNASSNAALLDAVGDVYNVC